MRAAAGLLLAIALALVCGCATSPAVVVCNDATDLERFAAAELCGYLEKLFDVHVTPTVDAPPSARNVFRVGVTRDARDDQAIVLKSVRRDGRRELIVGGGSPRATLWAVYELAERWDARFVLHGDALPRPRRFEMPVLDIATEPNLRVRQWRVLNEHAMGPISWGMDDYRPVIDQLAKLKFNRLLLYIWPGQPFLPLEFGGVRQTSGTLFFGRRFPITDDMIGRSLFGNEKEFWNPDLPPPGDPAKLTAAAVAHVRSLIDYAHARGLECIISASLTEIPREFKDVLAHTHPVDMVGTPTIGPGADADVDDPVLAELARMVLQTTIDTYPDVDGIALDLPEWREWTKHYGRAWKALDAKYQVEGVRPLQRILDAARKRTDYAGGPDRAAKEVQADIVALCFFDKLLSDSRVKIAPRKLVMSTVAEELYPIVARVLPKGSETLNFVDYTPSRILKRRAVLRDIPAGEIPSVLIHTLHDDNVGVLPQLATGSLAQLTDEIRELGWAGFSTRYWLIGDHDPCVAYLSRAAWDASATPGAIYRDQITHVCGEGAVEDMLTLFREVEAATQTLEWHGLGLTFPVPDMLMKHWSGGTLSPELKSVAPRYETALAAARRAMEKSAPRGRAYVRYWIGRLQFGIDYLAAIEAVHLAAAAESRGEWSEALSQAQSALELVKHGLESYADVARDRSDKGAIAVMNEYVYRPLVAKIEALKPKAPAVRATDFHSRKVYQSKQRPSYTSWASFFPGRDGWHLGFVEITTPDKPTSRATTQFVYEMSLPRGYDTSKFLQELVLLRSSDDLQTWKEIGRQPVLANGGSFAQAQTPDGVLHRFVWACYSRDPSVKPNDIHYQSRDGGETWKLMPPPVSDRFAWYPHRLRTLRDGTLVLCCPRAPRWGNGSEYPIRAAVRLDVASDMEMMLLFSHDQGKTWSNPLPVLAGQNVSETDFVELPDGNLLFINNSIFASPGRQFVYREGNRFTPGPLERVQSGTVPETICLIDDGILIGCHRPGTYHWSNDLGRNWHPLEGAPSTIEVYQPWIQHLGGGKIACAGHYGADDPIGGRDQFVSIHTFTAQTLRKTAAAKLWVQRKFDAKSERFLNAYTITLQSDGKPLAGKDIHVWCVARDQPGYDSFNSKPLAERMKLGGKSIVLRTTADGAATLDLPEFDNITDIHASYQLVIRFNPDGKDPDFTAAELPQLEFYANSGMDR